MSSKVIGDLSKHDADKIAEAKKAAQAAEGDAKVGALKAWHAAFNEHYQHVAKTLAEESEKAAAEEKAAADAEAEAKKAEDEVAKLEAELAALENGAGSGDDGKVKAAAGAPLANFFQKRAEVQGRLAVTAALVRFIIADPSKAFQLPNEEAAKLADQWNATADQFEKDVQELLADADALQKAQTDMAGDTTAKDVAALWDSLRNDANNMSVVAEEQKDRVAANEESVKEFEFERRRLLLWCRQQKTNLDAMVEPDHIQEFCASLLNNYTAMEENFSIIYERSLPLLPNNDIQAALLEVNEVWLNLQVCAYDRLRHTLLEIHHNSKLEDEVRAFSNYSQRAGAFLQDFSRLLATPTDADSKHVVKPVIDDCTALSKQFDAHKHLTEHLREFALRMECFRDNYQSLKRAVLSRLTFLAVTPTLATSQRRKDEYISRMKELRGWVEVKSQGESWSDIHDRVVKIRDLIEQEQQSLNQPAAKKE